MARGPVFLDKISYRQRRWRDAVRLLPILGLIAWMIPALWSRGDAGPGNAGALIYIFGVWVGVIILGAVIARRLNPSDPAGPERP